MKSESYLPPTVVLAIALMAIIVMMILPMPSWLLDIGLAASFGLAILMFTTTLFLDRPLDFSSFPTMLLTTLMLRLSLNVSSTKLIIGEGHNGTHAAGHVIEGFSKFIMGGSVFLGVVVFLVLLIVNFIVITKGATRMAEVSARFALDAMPGKQLSIDSDMSAGAIDHNEARERRQREQAETTFFGSLDGASKFVKGDAIAGLLITLLNLVVGFGVGFFVHQMPALEALQTYSILTVGDGLVTQIPAVIISIATALLLARGGTTGPTDFALGEQLSRHPKALITVGCLMIFFALVPGLPFGPFILGALILLGFGFFSSRKASDMPNPISQIKVEKLPEKSMGDILDLDEIHIEFSPDLVMMALDPATGLESRIRNLRSFVATTYGLILPEIRLTDNASLSAGQYRIFIHGVVAAEDRLQPDSVLALLPADGQVELPGLIVSEPVYSVPAKWISRKNREDAVLAGCTLVTPEEILATHLLEVVKSNCSDLLTLRGLRRLLDEFTNLSDQGRNEQNKQVLDDLIPEKISTETLLQVLRMLLSEQVSIRNLTLILESLAEARTSLNSADDLCEHVRRRLGAQLTSPLRSEDGTVPLIGLAVGWESIFEDGDNDDASKQRALLTPENCERLASGVQSRISGLNQTGVTPGVVTTASRRRFLRSVLKSKGIDVSVFSFDEIATCARATLVATVEV